MSDPKQNVRCGDCLWEGPVPELVKKDGLHYCPKCGREIMEYSLPPPSQASAGRTRRT